MEYTYLTTVHDESQSSFIESLLKSRGVRYELRNRQASGPVFGVGLRHLSFYVHPSDIAAAAHLLEDMEKEAGKPRGRFTKKKAHKKRRKKRPHIEECTAHDIDRHNESVAYAVLLVLAFIITAGLLLRC